MMLLSAVLGTFLLTMAAAGYFIVVSGSLNAIKSGGEAIQAQRYAEIEANKLSLLEYDEINSKVIQNKWEKVDSDEHWEYKIQFGPEKIIDPDKEIKQRIVTIFVKKENDSTERFQLNTSIIGKKTKIDGLLEDIGWVKLPNGLMIQWGYANVCWGCRKRINFPVSFKHKVFVGYVTDNSPGVGGNQNSTIYDITKTGATIFNGASIQRNTYLVIGI